VNETLRTSGLAVMVSPISCGMPVSTWISPAGMPARRASSARASAQNGVNSEGLITTGQPAASAGAHLRVIIAAGKFHGVIAAETPTGSTMTMMRRSRSGEATLRAPTRRPSSANHLMKLAA
jgi:hypothetical protein